MGAAIFDQSPVRARHLLVLRGVEARQGFKLAYDCDPERLAADGPGFPRLLAWAAEAGAAVEHLVADVCALAGLPVPRAEVDIAGCPPPLWRARPSPPRLICAPRASGARCGPVCIPIWRRWSAATP
ncbi:MAG: hypothetical protein ABIO70_27600 [Pseudomonadota bacterium]